MNLSWTRAPRRCSDSCTPPCLYLPVFYALNASPRCLLYGARLSHSICDPCPLNPICVPTKDGGCIESGAAPARSLLRSHARARRLQSRSGRWERASRGAAGPARRRRCAGRSRTSRAARCGASPSMWRRGRLAPWWACLQLRLLSGLHHNEERGR